MQWTGLLRKGSLYIHNIYVNLQIIRLSLSVWLFTYGADANLGGCELKNVKFDR